MEVVERRDLIVVVNRVDIVRSKLKCFWDRRREVRGDLLLFQWFSIVTLRCMIRLMPATGYLTICCYLFYRF